jgi:Ca-activated chloride channel family protein
MKVQVVYEHDWFLLLFIIPILCFLYWRFFRHYKPVLLVSTIPDLRKKYVYDLLSPAVLIFCIRLLVIFFSILALTNLRLLKNVTHNKAIHEADIVLAIDVSRSMEAEDIKPTRLEALKDVLNRFIAGRVNDRFGIVLYAGESINWCPLTKSYAFLTTRIKEIDDKALADGTAIGLGLTSAANVLHQSNSKNKIIILLTDGENNTGFIDPITAALIAKKFNIKVYTIGIGTNGLAPISIKDMNGNVAHELIPVSIDEKVLKEIAGLTGGGYFRATDSKALKNIYAVIDKDEETRTVQVSEIQYTPEYRFFAFSALFFLLLELALRFTLLRTWPE